MRAVDWIDDPDGSCVEVAGPSLLPKEAVVRKQTCQACDDEVLAFAVRLAHQVLCALAMDAEEFAPGKVIGGEPARFAHDSFRGAQAVIEIGRLQLNS